MWGGAEGTRDARTWGPKTGPPLAPADLAAELLGARSPGTIPAGSAWIRAYLSVVSTP